MANKSAAVSKPSKPIRLSDNVLRYNLEEYLPTAIEKQTGSDLYSNYVYVIVSEHEVTLDFYRASRIPGKIEIEVVHLQKVFLPLGVGKSLIKALETTLSNYEKTTGAEIADPTESLEEE